ncbi:hypothetical protein IAT38_006161 [Cryptococcus sp. DSM 104549]
MSAVTPIYERTITVVTTRASPAPVMGTHYHAMTVINTTPDDLPKVIKQAKRDRKKGGVQVVFKEKSWEGNPPVKAHNGVFAGLFNKLNPFSKRTRVAAAAALESDHAVDYFRSTETVTVIPEKAGGAAVAATQPLLRYDEVIHLLQLHAISDHVTELEAADAAWAKVKVEVAVTSPAATAETAVVNGGEDEAKACGDEQATVHSVGNDTEASFDTSTASSDLYFDDSLSSQPTTAADTTVDSVAPAPAQKAGRMPERTILGEVAINARRVARAALIAKREQADGAAAKVPGGIKLSPVQRLKDPRAPGGKGIRI